MANNEPRIMELSPSLKERLISSFWAMISCVLGIIAVVGALIVEDITNTMVQFAAIFIGGLIIFFSVWRILRIATVKLVVDSEEIRFRDRFVWRTINWRDVISVGRANVIEAKEHKSILKKIKSMMILTRKGIKKFEMSAYSTNHGIETINKVINARPKDTPIPDDSEIFKDEDDDEIIYQYFEDDQEE
jgi:hypothetical protein